MKKLLTLILVLVGVTLWFDLWGWLGALVPGVIIALYFLSNFAKKGSPALVVLSVLFAIAVTVFYFGAPVAAWFVWGPWGGIAYGVICALGLVAFLGDDTEEGASSESSEN